MNDERPIEKLLRRYAKKRREEAGAPPELHPAARRLLQGEVARQFGKTGAEKASSPGWLALLRVKWVYATAAACAVLLAAVWLGTNSPGPFGVELARQNNTPAVTPEPQSGGGLMTDREAPMRLAEPAPAKLAPEPGGAVADGLGEKQTAVAMRQEPARVASPAGAAAELPARTVDRGLVAAPPAPVASAAENEFYRRYGSGSGESTPIPDRLAGSVRSAPLPATAPAPAVRSPTVASADRREAAEMLRQPAPGSTRAAGTSAPKMQTNVPTFAPATTGASEPSGYALTAKQYADAQKSQVLAQRFANVSPTAELDKFARSKAGAPVLANFQIEQAGDQLRVIDSDGSTYLGKVVAPVVTVVDVPLKGAESLKRAEKVGFADALAPTATGVLYEVLGTNRTLNQQVRFTWSYLGPTNAPAQTLHLGAPVVPLPQLLNNSGVSGRVRISTGPEIEIRAQPVGP